MKKRKKVFSAKVSFYRGIRLKLIAAFFIPVILIVILGAVSYQKASQSVTNNYEKATKQTMEKTAEYLHLVFETVVSDQIEILMDSNFIGYYDGDFKGDPLKQNQAYDGIQQNFRSKIMGGKFINNIHVFAATEKPFSTAGMLDASVFQSFAEEPLAETFMQVNNETVFISSHPYLDDRLKLDSSDYALSAVRCFYDKGKPEGYLFVDIKLDVIKSVLDSLEFGSYGMKNIVTEDGVQLFESESNMDFSDKEFYKKAAASEENSGTEYVNIGDLDYLFLFSKIPVSHTMLCGLIPKGDILKETAEIKNITIYIVLIAVIIAVLTGAIISQGIGRSVSKIIIGVGMAAKGDLTTEIKVKRKDEFGILSESIKDMFLQMRQLIGKNLEISTIVTEKASGVENASEIFLSAAKDISMSIGDIELGAGKQAEDLEECLKQMASLAEKITVVNNAADKIDKIAANTHAITKEGMTMMEEMKKTSADTMVITKEVTSDIEKLESASAKIITIVSIMEEIAEQTSLLSLNAFIEAARGKEGGSGFAVVAKEIEKLAGQSKGATGKIQEIVNMIQIQTKNTVKTAKQADEIISYQEETLEKSMIVFYNMEEHMNGLTKGLDQIMGEIRNIESAKNETLQAIQNITAISTETAAESKEVDRMTKRQLEEAEKLYHFAGDLLLNAKKLKEEVSVFKIE